MKTDIKGALTFDEFVESAEKNLKLWYVSKDAELDEFEFSKVNKVVKYAGLETHRFYKLYANVFRYSDSIKLVETMNGLEAGNVFDNHSENGYFFTSKMDMTNYLKTKLSELIRQHPARLDLYVENFPELLV